MYFREIMKQCIYLYNLEEILQPLNGFVCSTELVIVTLIILLTLHLLLLSDYYIHVSLPQNTPHDGLFCFLFFNLWGLKNRLYWLRTTDDKILFFTLRRLVKSIELRTTEIYMVEIFLKIINYMLLYFSWRVV